MIAEVIKTVVADGLIADIRWTSGMSPVWIFLLAACVAIAVGLFYLRETRHLASPLSFVLPALRSVAVAMTILTLAAPVWHRETVVGTLGRVIFAVDASASMSIGDSQTSDEPSRYENAVADLTDRMFGSENGLVESLRDTHEVQVVTFADGPVNVVPVDEPAESNLRGILMKVNRDAAQTDLTAAIALAKRRSTSDEETPDERRRTAVVILSDGQDNVGRPIRIVEDADTMIHTIGYGSPSEPSDIGITRVQHPDTVADDGSLVGQVSIKRAGVESPIEVTIAAADRVVWRETISSTTQDVVDFEIPVVDLNSETSDSANDQNVVYDLSVSVRSVDANVIDAIGENNETSFRVAAATRRRQLLILDGSVRWETRYLRNLFDRDPTWQVTSLLFGPGTDMPRLQRGSQPGQFPATDTDWSRYDAVVLGEVPTDQIAADDIGRLREFVRRGGGLIVLDGRYGRIDMLAKRGDSDGENSIADLLPVRLGPMRTDPIAALSPSDRVMDMPMFNLAGNASDSKVLWQSIPPPAIWKQTELSVGGETWMDLETADGVSSPMIATRLYGGGRVVYFAADETWRWRYKVADRYHSRFWNAMLAAVMQPPYAATDRFAAIATDAISYSPDQRPEIRVRLRDGDGQAVGDATVDAVLQRDGEIVATVPLLPVDPERGTYRGVASSLPEGRYEVGVRASGYDSRQLTASTPIWIGRESLAEYDAVSLDEGTLQTIASRSGGSYLHHSDIEQLPSLLEPISSGRRVTTDLAIWQTWWWFGVILALLSLEWLLRKTGGLV